MKKETLSDAIGNISDEKIEQAKGKHKNVLKFTVKQWVALAACVALAITAVFGIPRILPKTPTPPDVSTTASGEPSQNATEEPTTSPLEPTQLGYQKITANYPKQNSMIHLNAKQNDLAKTTSFDFFSKTIASFLKDHAESNAVFSPINLYVTLGALAELADSDSREQILDLLGVTDIETLRETVYSLIGTIFADEYSLYEGNEGILNMCLPATAFWLNNNADVSFTEEAKNALANDYMASFFSGDPANEEYQTAYKEWIKKYTAGALDDGTDSLSEETVFTLTSALLFAARWRYAFFEENNFTDSFHAPDGDIQVEYMHQENTLDEYYETDSFIAVSKNTYDNNNKTWFLLPKEGRTVEEVLQGADYVSLMQAIRDDSVRDYEKKGYTYVGDLTLPKFDVTSNFDLEEYLNDFGVTCIFDHSTADFSNFSAVENGKPIENIYVQEAFQKVRMTVNEEGVAAVAFGKIDGGAGDGGLEEIYVDVVLDRPFITMVISSDGLPLFTAVVNNPQQS